MKKVIDRATVRQVIGWLHQITAAGRLSNLLDAIDDARRQFRDEHNGRTVGDSPQVNLADFAASLLGLDRQLCDEAVADVLGWRELVIETIRTEAERLTARPSAAAQPKRQRRVVE
jgi:hypothetical protein